MNTQKIKNTSKAWEDRRLGGDTKFVGVADASHEDALERALKSQKHKAAKAPSKPLLPAKRKVA